MGVVIVQSRATAHVFRVFGALVALLILMGLAVTFLRLRSQPPMSSPYGALTGLATDSPSVTTPIAQRTAAVTTAPLAPAAPVADAAQPAPTSADAPRPAPRQIAIDKAAAASPQPQPAPPAVVQAAVRAAQAPVPAPAAVIPPAAPVAAASPAAIPAPPVPAVVAVADPAPPAAAEPPPAGLININTASAEALNNLPGGGHIGRTIVRHRPYRSIDDLVDHRVLKARDLARIRAAITVD